MRWQRHVSQENATTLHEGSEAARLRTDRQLGWSAVPSNTFISEKDGDTILLRGVGQGHGVGLCQLGAKAMAEDGATFREILEHYYPNTSIRAYDATRKARHSAITRAATAAR